MQPRIATEDITRIVKSYILENYLFGYEEKDLSDELSLIHSGVIDSTGVLDFIVFLENAFEIEIMDTEILPENLDSVSAASRFVDRKRNGLQEAVS